MAKIYELHINRELVDGIVKDCGLTLGSGADGELVSNLMSIFNQPYTFQKVLMSGKPGFCLRMGRVQTEAFDGEGIHFFIHSGSEGYLDTIELVRRLESSLERQGVSFKERM